MHGFSLVGQAGRFELISMYRIEGWILVSRVYLIGYLEGRDLYITLLYSLTLPLSSPPHATSCIYS